MSEKPVDDRSIEPERYELAEGPAYRFELGRRDFVKMLGGGILVVCALDDALALQESGGERRPSPGREAPQEIGAWLHIGEDGSSKNGIG